MQQIFVEEKLAPRPIERMIYLDGVKHIQISNDVQFINNSGRPTFARLQISRAW